MSDFLSRFRKREDEEPAPEPSPREASGTPPDPAPPDLDHRRLEAFLEPETREDRVALERLERRQGEMEAALREMGRALEAVQTRLEGVAAAATKRDMRQPVLEPGVFREAWEAAPLPLRLQFTRGLLPGDHPLQPALTEASALVELWAKGAELEAWIHNYPALFADAYMRLLLSEASAGGAAAALARETAAEARALLDGGLRALGIEWIEPRPGEAVSEAHAVVGEEAVPDVPPGRIAGTRRRGFRWRGSMHLPAQVTRCAPCAPPRQAERAPAAGPAPVHPYAQTPAVTRPVSVPLPEKTVPSEAPAPSASAERWPEWLRSLQRRGMGSAPPAVREAVQALAGMAERGDGRQAPDGELRGPALAVLPLLGAGLNELPPEWMEAFGSTREEMLRWLREEFGLELVTPSERSLFVPGVMEVVGERRTAHPHEEGKVAKMERPGLLRNGQVFIPARVVRYESGEAW